MLIWSSSYNVKIDTEFVAPFIMYDMCVNGTCDHLNQWHGGQSIKWRKHILIRESQYICTRLNYKWSVAWINGNKWHTTCFWMFKLCHKLVLYWNSIMFPHKAHRQLETPITFLQKKRNPHHRWFWALLVKSRQRFPGPRGVLCIIPKTT